MGSCPGVLLSGARLHDTFPAWGGFVTIPLRAGPAGQVLEAPPAAVSSLLRDQRWVLVSPP